MSAKTVKQAYRQAQDVFGAWGVDTRKAMDVLSKIPISMQCWQGDDVGGFERSGEELGGGIAATGNYPGRARTADELRGDLEEALKLIPGLHRVNLHAIYAETDGRKVERNELRPRHFARWADWAKERKLGLDFNPTFFSHPKAADGFTLASRDSGLRRFWIEHGIACRKIGESFGRKLGKTCVTNVWIPDGYKDQPVDRKTPRRLLEQSLDKMFSVAIDPKHNIDSVEGKLFGLGSESYVAGSHDFYLGYAIRNGKLLCLDTGHFHPTESVADKLTAVLPFLKEVLLHVSRGVRWDSDHVVVVSDEMTMIAQEIVRGGYLKRVHIGLDYFDASINRVAAWVIGMRCMLRALAMALLEPVREIRALEEQGDLTSRLALQEEIKTLPFAAVWDYYCHWQDVPVGRDWLKEVKRYESRVLARRG